MANLKDAFGGGHIKECQYEAAFRRLKRCMAAMVYSYHGKESEPETNIGAV